ncbi:MAG: NUDIX domain-containing protein, partial [Anaerolineales bacterium]|nr:NUDIX domain-containing protein [Anaerolineales bacterium]
DRYLLLRRAQTKDHGAGSWECVTGRVDQGEGFLDALRREVREELGVDVTPAFFVGTTHFYRGAPQPENELLGVVFACTVADPAAIRLSHEHDAHRWLTAAEAAAFLDQAQPAARWLRTVIARAAALRRLHPPALLAYWQTHGFETDE